MRLRAWLCAPIIAACTPAATRDAAPSPAPVSSGPPAPRAAAASATAAPTPPSAAKNEALLIVTDPDALAVIESRGGSLAALLGTSAGSRLDELGQTPQYSSIATVLKGDLDTSARRDKLSGTSVARFAHRLMDARWLTAATAHFELVGISNRFDRRPFDEGACGEVRFVYRARYATQVGGKQLASRLPIFLIAELRAEAPDATGSCQAAARRWLAPADLSGAKLGEWLVAETGPLGAGRVAPAALSRLNVNLQSVRWPSTVRPDLGGHAEYLLLTFVRDGERFRVEPLENTPDVARLRGEPKRLAALVEWLGKPETLVRIDAGTALVPREFLATSALSVTPHGLARRANRPYRQLLAARDLASLALANYRNIKTPEALIRRLDDLSCPGCHQSRSLAGFHLLGVDGDDTARGNALAVALSPHLERDLGRRRTLLERAAAGQSALDYSRPFAERASEGDAGYGSHCGLGDAGFATWTCNQGLSCQAHDVERGEPPTVGVCLPATKGAGDPCEAASVVQNDDPHRDRIAKSEELDCPASASVCNRSAVGFPGGMCTADCASLPHEAACGAIAVLTSFNDCLAKNLPFSSCIAENSTPAGLRRCSAAEPCRDDYLCARTARGEGACIPPYFLFQMRVDGHPSP